MTSKIFIFIFSSDIRLYLNYTHRNTHRVVLKSHLALRVLQQSVLGVYLLLDGVVDVQQHDVAVLAVLTQSFDQLLLPLVSQSLPLPPPLPQLLVFRLLAPDKLLLQLMKPEGQNSLSSACSYSSSLLTAVFVINCIIIIIGLTNTAIKQFEQKTNISSYKLFIYIIFHYTELTNI